MFVLLSDWQYKTFVIDKSDFSHLIAFIIHEIDVAVIIFDANLRNANVKSSDANRR